jgi:hypothetical protein
MGFVVEETGKVYELLEMVVSGPYMRSKMVSLAVMTWGG